MRRIATTLILALTLFGLSACGFQLRGHSPTVSNIASPLYISGLTVYSPLHRELAHQLQDAGVALAGESANASSVLRISERRSDRRLLAVDGSNKGVEFELEESARISLLSGQAELVPEQTVRVLRIQYRPKDQILGRNREEDVMRKDMHRDLAGRIVQHLSSQR